MRILLLSAANNVHTVRWANALAERGNRVHLVYQPNHKPTLHMISKNVVLHSLKYSGDAGYFLNALELHRLCNRIEPDIVNAHYASGYGTLARLAKLRPLVLSVWGSDVYDFPYRNKLNLTILRRNLTYANQLASTSYCMADQVRRVLEGEDVDIEVTPFGVDTAVFSRKERHRNSTLICIGTVKALSPKYGICDLVRAVKILKENLESRGLSDISGRIVVRIYGDGPQKNEIAQLIQQLHLTETISLEGAIPHSMVPNVLEKMDIFCVASVLDSESFGVAAVEAMAMELPVVATDVDGFREVVSHGETGLIIPRGNPSAMAQALEKLVLNPDLRKRMGTMGRARVLKLYDWESNVDTMLKVYEKCLNRYRQRRVLQETREHS